MSQNHVIDPTYFYDAINEFAFDYNWYVIKSKYIDDRGNQKANFEKRIIRGSLQSQGTAINREITGNTESMSYNFYCKSLYRINIGDFIEYKDRWLIVTEVRDYDEWGVRSVVTKMTNLNNHRDFREWLDYVNGDKIV